MIKKILMIAALGMTGATAAYAADATQVEKSIELKDGTTLYVFKDGKMSMENKYGRVISMEPGHIMETKDGKKIIMIGNEVWRLDELLHKDHRG